MASFCSKSYWQYFRSGGLHGYQNKEDCNLNQSKLYSFVGGLTKNNSEKIENATKLQTISGLIVLFLPQLCLANSLQSGDNSRYSYSNREKAATNCPLELVLLSDGLQRNTFNMPVVNVQALCKACNPQWGSNICYFGHQAFCENQCSRSPGMTGKVKIV